MPYFQVPVIGEDVGELEVTDELNLEEIHSILQQEVSLLDSMSIKYKICSGGRLCYNSKDDCIYLPTKEILHLSVKYKAIIEESKRYNLLADTYEMYIQNLIQLIICHEAGHALSESKTKISKRAVELVDNLIDSVLELDHQGIYLAEKELHTTKYNEEVNAWILGRRLMTGDMELYDFIRDYELNFYKEFIDDRMKELSKRICDYPNNVKK